MDDLNFQVVAIYESGIKVTSRELPLGDAELTAAAWRAEEAGRGITPRLAIVPSRASIHRFYARQEFLFLKDPVYV